MITVVVVVVLSKYKHFWIQVLSLVYAKISSLSLFFISFLIQWWLSAISQFERSRKHFFNLKFWNFLVLELSLWVVRADFRSPSSSLSSSPNGQTTKEREKKHSINSWLSNQLSKFHSMFEKKITFYHSNWYLFFFSLSLSLSHAMDSIQSSLFFVVNLIHDPIKRQQL